MSNNVIVPVEPTEAMLLACDKALRARWEQFADGTKPQTDVRLDTWRAMVAAASPVGLYLGAKVISEYGLHCGSGSYDWACVVSLNPLILVSEEGDMRWDHKEADKLTVIGMVTMEQLAVCVSRVARDAAFTEAWNNALSATPVAWAVVHPDSGKVLYVDLDQSKVEAVADDKPPKKVLPLVLGKERK